MVKVPYTGRLADGTILIRRGSATPGVHPGRWDILPGVEQAVLSMTAGESKAVTIPAAHAYGPHQPARVLELERHHLLQCLHPEVGQHLHMQGKTGGHWRWW
jgi:FKBP-type peptidyl-prolyl cis-trans isomerase 2